MKKYKLYIWRDVRCDYTSGIAFGVGRDVEEARNSIREMCEKDDARKWEWSSYRGELMKDPDIYDLPAGDWISGGG